MRRHLQIPVLAGRTFDSQDKKGSRPVAVISHSLVKQVFPGGNAIGQVVDAAFGTPVQIVGIVGDVHHLGMTSELTSETYVSFGQFLFRLICVAIQTERNPMAVAKEEEKQVWALDKNQAVSYLIPLTDLENSGDVGSLLTSRSNCRKL